MAPIRGLQAADRQAWRDLYARAPPGDIWHPLPFLGDLIERVRPIQGLPFVDLACGDGGQICGLPTGLRTIGIDQAPGAVARAGHRLEKVGRSEVTLREALVECTGLDDGAAGGAMLIDVLSCFLDPAPVLAEARRILAPGARLLITTFTPDDPLARSSGAVPATPVWIEGFINVFYDPDQVGRLLALAGFTVEYVARRRDEETGHPAYRGDSHEHDRAILVARKPAA